MKIKMNGKSEEITGIASIAAIDLLKRYNVNPEMVSVEVNDTILKREEFTTAIIKDGDTIEFLYFMGGGSQCAVRVSLMLGAGRY